MMSVVSLFYNIPSRSYFNFSVHYVISFESGYVFVIFVWLWFWYYFSRRKLHSTNTNKSSCFPCDTCTLVCTQIYSKILRKDSNGVCKSFSLLRYLYKASNYQWRESDWSFWAAHFQFGILNSFLEGCNLRELNQLQTSKEVGSL